MSTDRVSMKNKWVTVDFINHPRSLPKARKYVLVKCTVISDLKGLPPAIVVGYLKYPAGDKKSPYFVTPGADQKDIIAFNDCLPDDFRWN